MRSFFSSTFLCLFAAVFFLLSCREKIPHIDGGEEPVPEVVEEDPILQIEEPGAYGVPGGNVVLRDGWQLGIMRYGGSWQNLRMIQPARARVISLSGLPRPLEKGMEFQAIYLETEQGFTRVCIPYRLQVIQVKDEKVWLKESDQTFFVVEQ